MCGFAMSTPCPAPWPGADAPGCLVLDHDVFVRMLNGNNERRFAKLGFPVILMVGHKNERTVARAVQSGVTHVVETPLLATVLLDTISSALGETMPLRRAQRPS
jgi:FixJ family two-component response regulator